MEKDYKKRIKDVYSIKEVIDLYSNVGFWKVEQIVINEYIEKKIPLKILDAGCGAGRISIELAKMGNDVYGIDISEKILKEAQLNKDNLQRLCFINSDLLNIPSKPLSFDCIISFYSVLGLIIEESNRKKILQEFHRVLRPNGLLIIHVHNLLYPGCCGKRWIRWIIHEWCNLFTKNKLEFGTRLVNETGFKLYCHYFTLWEIKRLINLLFKIIKVIPSNGFWKDNRHSNSELFSEDWYIVCRKA